MTELEQAARAFGEWLLAKNLWTAAVLAIVVVADRLLASRVRPAWRALLYVAVLLRLFVPMDWTRGTGLAGETVLAIVPQAMTVVGPAPDVPPAEIAATTFPWAVLGLGMYVTVAVVLFALWLRAHRKLGHVVRASRLVRTVSDNPGEHLPLLVHERWGPGVVGIAQPRIVVPLALVEESPERLDWVLRHETAHVRRADTIVLPLLQLTTFALWAVLPLWAALRQFRRLMEMACDEIALAGAVGRRRREYGELLMELGDLARPSRWMEVTMNHDLPSRVRELRYVSRWRRSVQWTVPAVMALSLILFVGPGPVDAGDATASGVAETVEKDPPQSRLPCPTPDASVPACVEAIETYDRNVEDIWDLKVTSEGGMRIVGSAASSVAVANLVSDFLKCETFKDFELKRAVKTDDGSLQFTMLGFCEPTDVR